ncbi:DUF2141 domain-containing protein [Paucibacter sp. APW11]|uniref:DUF2141 domain-containing protein n=1 Tax=Roseateles aquae TaxID=3077235 RepID=A0ABU3PBB9_9BURK|nr:DUF2141 domain-containing protein [Paucibacter sp. APW11]MDT8999865.1 DUF2141 domain-containing protein [Paucibacter sp. APW11]
MGLTQASVAATGSGEFEYRVSGLRNDAGVVRAVLCAESERFPNSCKLSEVVKSQAGSATFVFRGVAAGNYAFAAFHDEDGDGRLRMSPDGRVLEGFVFGNDAIGRAGPPPFKAAAQELKAGGKFALRIRYMR